MGACKPVKLWTKRRKLRTKAHDERQNAQVSVRAKRTQAKDPLSLSLRVWYTSYFLDVVLESLAAPGVAWRNGIA